MHAVLGDFIYALSFSWLIGKPSLYFLARLSGAIKKEEAVNERFSSVDIVFAGVVALTVLAQFWSLFDGVGWVFGIPYLLLLALSVFLAIRFKNKGYKLLPRGISVAGVFLLLVFAYGTTHGIEHYDTGLYHVQAILWNGVTGVVKGLGNLHTRLAYNSSALVFSAVFDTFNLQEKELTRLDVHSHSMAGFMALLLAWKCLPLVRGWFEKNETGGVRRWRLSEKRKVCLSDFARLIAIYYLFMIYDEMVSPAPDYFVTCTLLYLVIAWLDVTEKETEGVLTPQDAAHRYALLCVAAVYGVTLKLSVAPLLLLTIYAVWRLCFAGRDESEGTGTLTHLSVLIYFLAGCVVIAPFLIRNYYLSGYLIYPFPAIDLFDVEWKIPQGVALYDAREIAVYGRGYTDVLRYGEPLSAWLPAWFASLGLLDKGMFLINCALPVVAVVMFCVRRRESEGTGTVTLFSQRGEQPFVPGEKRVTVPVPLTHLLIVLYIQFLFWFLSAPLVRYGKMILWLPAILTTVVTIRSLYRWDVGYRTKHIFAVAVFLLFFLYKSAMLIRDDIPRADVRWLTEQQPYAHFALEEYDVIEAPAGMTVTLYAPSEGDRVGSELLASPNRERVETIGDWSQGLGTRAGFRAAEE